MSVKNFSLVSAFIFLAIGLLHVLRIVYGAEAVIAGWYVPMWASGAGSIVAFVLAFFGFQINRMRS